MRISLLSDTAPPPINPRLQYCIEAMVFEEFDRNGDAIRTAIGNAGKLDASYLPNDIERDLKASLDLAGQTFDKLATIRETELAVDKAAPAYRPILRQVRRAEQDIAKIDVVLAEHRTRLSRIRDSEDNAEDRRQRLQERMADREAEREALAASIPAAWEETHKTFAVLQTDEDKARAEYRRGVDRAYEPIVEIIALLERTPELAELGEELKELGTQLGLPAADLEAKVQDLTKKLNPIPGTDDIRDELQAMRKLLRGSAADPAKLKEAYDEGAAPYESERARRTRAQSELLPGLTAYEASIRETIGLRKQPRLTEDSALEIARCASSHRDVSLNF
jgi:chromosome segregation ATPase